MKRSFGREIGGAGDHPERPGIDIASCKLTEAEIAAALEILESGQLAQGPAVAAFERKFADRMEVACAVACASGTAALHLVYGLLLEPGDEVLVPAMTFLSTASMLRAVGCAPVFCDVDAESWLIDLDDAARKLTTRSRAIVPVHLFGNPCDPSAVQQFAAAHGLQIIGDAAQAHGARFAGRGIGNNGIATIFSLYATKNLFVGEGGMICCADEEMAAELRRRRSHGFAEDGYARSLGFNYRLPQMLAAIGGAQLRRFDQMMTRRRDNAALLTAGLHDLPGLRFQRAAPAAEHAFHQFCVLVDERNFGMDRDTLAVALNARGIGTAIHYRIPLHRQPLFGSNDAAAPVTDEICSRILALPVHHDLSPGAVAAIIDAVRDAYHAQAKRSQSA